MLQWGGDRMCCSGVVTGCAAVGWWLDVLQWGGGWMCCSGVVAGCATVGWWQCVRMCFKIDSCYFSTSLVEEAKPKGRKSRATGDIYSDGEGEERVAVEGEPSKKKRRRFVIKSVLLTSNRLSR